jgi:hypothetical protein
MARTNSRIALVTLPQLFFTLVTHRHALFLTLADGQQNAFRTFDVRTAPKVIIPSRRMRYSDELQADFPAICVTKIDAHAVAAVYSNTVFREKHYPVVD